MGQLAYAPHQKLVVIMLLELVDKAPNVQPTEVTYICEQTQEATQAVNQDNQTSNTIGDNKIDDELTSDMQEGIKTYDLNPDSKISVHGVPIYFLYKEIQTNVTIEITFSLTLDSLFVTFSWRNLRIRNMNENEPNAIQKLDQQDNSNMKKKMTKSN